MRCELCGKNYVALGVHLRHKHKVDPDDYRDEFGILRVTPLVDAVLSETISAAAKIRLKDADYLAECKERCKENAGNRLGKGGMSVEGKRQLAERDRKNHLKYLVSKAPEVRKILAEKKTIHDVRRDLGMGPSATKKIIGMGLAQYDKEIALIVGTQRRVASRMRK